MNKPVGFKLAKLLKEKEYQEKVNTKYGYCDGGEIDELEEFSAPTIADVIMWLCEKHEIWIHVCYMVDTKNWWWDCYRYKKENGLLNHPGFSNGFNHQSPMEAYETAIFHILAHDLLSYQS
jgi:hypothetical protein